jgi:integrase
VLKSLIIATILRLFLDDLRAVINQLMKDITLYSFRHTGAIEIFKRTGSITKLQKAMGHSFINVSLTYLRGLEIAELKEKDMPMV